MSSWLDALADAFPQLEWDVRRRTSYVAATKGFSPDAVRAVTNAILGGDWGEPFPPVPAQFASMCKAADSQRRAEVERVERQAEVRQRDSRTAPPWHPNLWLAWLVVENGRDIPDGLGPYVEIVRETGLTPESAGVSFSPRTMGLVWDRALVQDRYHRAVERAEAVWRGSGSTESAEQAALRALAAMAAN